VKAVDFLRKYYFLFCFSCIFMQNEEGNNHATFSSGYFVGTFAWHGRAM